MHLPPDLPCQPGLENEGVTLKSLAPKGLSWFEHPKQHDYVPCTQSQFPRASQDDKLVRVSPPCASLLVIMIMAAYITTLFCG